DRQHPTIELDGPLELAALPQALAVDPDQLQISLAGVEGVSLAGVKISQRVGPKGPSVARVSERAQAKPSTIRVRLAGVKISQRVGPKGPSEARVSERAQAQPSTIRVRLAGVKKASESDRRARATNSSLSAGAARACVVGDLAVLARAPTGVGVGWIVAVTAGQRADPGLELTDRLAEIAQIGALL